MNNNHEGHRQRLRNRVKKYGLNSLEEHEVLELILSYAIPRKDTNSIAHELLNKFDSLSGVLDADEAHLKLIKGIGGESCFFLKILKDFINIYLENKNKAKNIILKNNNDVVKYFHEHFLIDFTETFIGFCLSKKGRLLNYFVVRGKSETEIEFPVKTLVENVSPDAVQQLILVHTHPNGNVSPSTEDIETTNRISSICLVLGCNLIDHIIINSKTYCSFKDLNLIPKGTTLNSMKVVIEKDGFIIKKQAK